MKVLKSKLIALVSFLSVLVIHELGHSLGAMATGIAVVRFQIGFGISIAQAWLGHTRFELFAIPLGGYNHFIATSPELPLELQRLQVERALEGIECPSELREYFLAPERWITSASLATNLLVSVAGVALNILFGLLMLLLVRYLRTDHHLGPVQRWKSAAFELGLDISFAVRSMAHALRRPWTIVGSAGLFSLFKELGDPELDDPSESIWLARLEATAFFSIGCGILNLLPIPSLDGWGIWFLLLQAIDPTILPASTSASLLKWGFWVAVSAILIPTAIEAARLVTREAPRA